MSKKKAVVAASAPPRPRREVDPLERAYWNQLERMPRDTDEGRVLGGANANDPQVYGDPDDFGDNGLSF